MFDTFESFEKATTAWQNMDGQKTLKYFWSPMPNFNVTGWGTDLDYHNIEYRELTFIKHLRFLLKHCLSLSSWICVFKFPNQENFPMAVKTAVIWLVNHTIYGWLPSKPCIYIPCRSVTGWGWFSGLRLCCFDFFRAKIVPCLHECKVKFLVLRVDSDILLRERAWKN